MSKLTQIQFVEKATKLHGKRYDYSESYYKGRQNKISIRCFNHGPFEQLDNNHLNGQGCPICSHNKRLNQEEFVVRSKKIHGEKYDYSSTIYSGYNYYVNIECKLHGIFKQKPASHYNGQGCPKCANNVKKNIDAFINEAQLIHGIKYDYSQVEYKSANENVIINCAQHGYFKQRPANHIHGEGCPVCKSSKGETAIEQFLVKGEFLFERQKRFEDCRDLIPLSFDFYLTKEKICIEYDGIQHFKSIEYFGGHDGFVNLKKRDKIKDDFCKKNNIYLIRIPYTMKNIINFLNENLCIG